MKDERIESLALKVRNSEGRQMQMSAPSTELQLRVSTALSACSKFFIFFIRGYYKQYAVSSSSCHSLKIKYGLLLDVIVTVSCDCFLNTEAETPTSIHGTSGNRATCASGPLKISPNCLTAAAAYDCHDHGGHHEQAAAFC